MVASSAGGAIIIGSTDVKFVISRISEEDGFVPQLYLESVSNILDSESPEMDHVKLSEEEFKILLLGISCDVINKATEYKAGQMSLDDIANIVLNKAKKLGAVTRIEASRYSSEDNEPFEGDSIPGSVLRTCRNTEFSHNGSEKIYTYYQITKTISDFFEYTNLDEGIDEIWVLINYTVSFEVDENDRLVKNSATNSNPAFIDIALQDSKYEQSLPLGWLDFRKEEIAKSVRKVFELLIRDSIESIFLEPKTEDEKLVYDPTPDN